MKIDVEETKRRKAKQMRYKKPIAKDLNLSAIQEELWDIQGECENVCWFCDTDEETLINALDGDEDEAYEFKMMFADLCAECEQMSEDLNEEWVPECFDISLWSETELVGGGIMNQNPINRLIKINMDMMDIATEDGLNFDNRLGLGFLAFTSHIQSGIKAIVELKHNYASLKAQYEIEKEKNEELREMLDSVFGDRDIDTIRKDVLDDIMNYSKRKINELERAVEE